MKDMNRRTAIKTLVAGGTLLTAGSLHAEPGRPEAASVQALKGNIHHSVSKWCFGSYPLDEFCEICKRIGIESVELLDPKDWPVVQKHGLTVAMCQGAGLGIDKGFNDGPNGNIVFLQVTDQRQWYISTDRKLKDVVVGIPGTEYISKAAVPYLKKGDEAGAYKTYAKRVADLMAYYNKHGKGWQPEKEFPWLAVVGALIAGVVVASAYKKSLIAAMSNVRREVSADAYLDQGSFALENEHDTYLYTNVTYTPKPRQGHRGAGSVSTSSSDGGHGGGGGGY